MCRFCKKGFPPVPDKAEQMHITILIAVLGRVTVWPLSVLHPWRLWETGQTTKTTTRQANNWHILVNNAMAGR